MGGFFNHLRSNEVRRISYALDIPYMKENSESYSSFSKESTDISGLFA